MKSRVLPPLLSTVVFLSSLASAHAQQPLEDGAAVDREGLKIDASVASDFAAVNPAVATALVSLRDGTVCPGTNLLRGAVAFPGMPTIKTFELLRSWKEELGGEEQLESRESSTYAPLPPGRFLQVRWDVVELDAETLQVTFYTEVIDEDLRVYQKTNPDAVLLIEKSTRNVLSLSER